MFTYGYIREATMAHLDIDEQEANAMNLLSRFHIFANEAMQAICASKPRYEYVNITVVDKYTPLVMDGVFIRPMTDVDKENGLQELNEESTLQYYHDRNTYLVDEQISMSGAFIAFADKQSYKRETNKKDINAILEIEAFGKTSYKQKDEKVATEKGDFSYLGSNKLSFHKTGKFFIPAKFMWYRFTSGMSDDTILDIPSDILLTIPIYIASICLQMDNAQKANIKRSEFEMALSRCTSTDFMPLIKVGSSW